MLPGLTRLVAAVSCSDQAGLFLHRCILFGIPSPITCRLTYIINVLLDIFTDLSASTVPVLFHGLNGSVMPRYSLWAPPLSPRGGPVLSPLGLAGQAG